LVTGIDVEKLMLALLPAGAELIEKTIPSMPYCVFRTYRAGGVKYVLAFGVYSSTEECAEVFEKTYVRAMSLPDRPEENIADATYGDGKSRVVFRWRNVMAGIEGPEARALAKSVLRRLKEQAPKGKRVPVPEIVEVECPKKLEAGKISRVRLFLRVPGANYALVGQGGIRAENALLTAFTQGLGPEHTPGPLKLEYVLATETNVVFRVTVSLEVIPAAKRDDTNKGKE